MQAKIEGKKMERRGVRNEMLKAEQERKKWKQRAEQYKSQMSKVRKKNKTRKWSEKGAPLKKPV